MSIPGFTAQASLDPTGPTGHDRGQAAPRGRTSDVVTPAAPCCSSCATACTLYPNSSFCQGCKRHGCLINC